MKTASPNRTFPAFLLILVVILISKCSPLKETPLLTLDGVTMGTFYHIKIVKDGEDSLYDPIPNGITRVLERVNQQMSTYIEDSEISRFNRYRGTDWFPISKDLLIVLKYALKASEKSDGAFDITVGPLVNLWGFGPEDHPQVVPSPEEIGERLKKIGYKNLELRPSPPAVRKKIPELYCDLSAIAKGFGVDRVAGYLDSLHIGNYLVEIGGEVRAKGHNAKHQDWRIGISSPANPANIQKIISVSNRSVATSGDYRNYFEKNGVRFSHTIDPRTGRPITHGLASVTVLHDSCMVADALATAIDVLGPEKGYELALREELAVFLIVKEKQGFIEKMTPQFEAVLAQKH